MPNNQQNIPNYNQPPNNYNQPPSGDTGMAVAGLVLGILACALAFVPIIGAPGAVILGLVGLPLASVSLAKNKKAKKPIGLAVAGLVLSIAAFAIVYAWGVFFTNKVSEVVDEVETGLQDFTEGIEESVQEAKDEIKEKVLTTFNADTSSEAIEVVGDLKSWRNSLVSFTYKPSEVGNCQYHLSDSATLRSYIEEQDAREFSINDWNDYSQPVKLNNFVSHILAKNCGTWTQVE